STTMDLAVRPRSTAELEPARSLFASGDDKREVLVATVEDVRTVHLFREDLHLKYDPDPLSTEVERTEDGYRVTVRATSFTRNVALLVDQVAPDAEVDAMLVTLIAGESHTCTVRPDATIDPADVTRAPLRRSANSLHTTPGRT